MSASVPVRPDAALLALRPTVPAETPDPADATLGHFLHSTLRPLLKLQHHLILLTVADFAGGYHIPLASADLADRQRLLTELISRNMNLRYSIVGQVVGQFTAEEIAFYRQHRAIVNRRVLALATQRVREFADYITQLLTE